MKVARHNGTDIDRERERESHAEKGREDKRQRAAERVRRDEGGEFSRRFPGINTGVLRAELFSRTTTRQEFRSGKAGKNPGKVRKFIQCHFYVNF